MKRTLEAKLESPRRAGAGGAVCWLGLCLLGLLLCAEAAAQDQAAVEAWVRRHNFGEASSDDQATKVVADADGNVIVAGFTDDLTTTGRDILILKYSGAGVALWTNRYDGPGQVRDIVLDGSGNVFVTGSSTGSEGNEDYVTIGYSGAGVALWTNYYNGPGNDQDDPRAVAVDNRGNVFVTGYSYGIDGQSHYATITYSGTGVALWTNLYNGSGNAGSIPNAIAVDGGGRVFVTGSSFNETTVDCVTIAYSGTGVALWTNRYTGPDNDDYAYALAVGKNGHVIVTGASGADFATIAYSGAGVALWTNRYSGPDNGTGESYAVVVDGSGNVFVTGISYGTESYPDYATIAYSSAGVALWTNRYDGPANGTDQPNALAVDSRGNVFVTGYSADNLGNSIYATIAYSGAGVALWTNHYKGASRSYDDAVALAVDNLGNVFVTGYSSGSEDYFDFATIAYSGTGQELWVNRYNGRVNVTDSASALAVGNNGSVFVTGTSLGSYATIAYSAAGVPLWTNHYNGQANAVAVDFRGNVFVTGTSDNDYATVAYSVTGVALWTNRYNRSGRDDRASGLAVDNRGNVYVTGSSAEGIWNSDYATVAYLGTGVPLWTNLYHGPGNSNDFATALAVDSTGNVLVTGSSFGSGTVREFATISYSAAGVALWTNRYSGSGFGDFASAVAVDGNGNVFVTGSAHGIGFRFNADYATIAYSKAGEALWTNHYNGPSNSDDRPNAIAVDNRGNVFVTGRSKGFNLEDDYATIAYSGAGVALWTNRYDGPGNGADQANAIAVDRSGNVVVTGHSMGGDGNVDNVGNVDYATIAYSSAGVPLWTNRYNGPANGDDYAGTKCLATSPDGAVYVTGSSDGQVGGGEISDYATVKYVWRPRLAIHSLTPGPSTVNLRLSGAALNSSWSIERALRISGPWTNLGSSLIGTNGLGTFQDVSPPASGAFYRAAQP